MKWTTTRYETELNLAEAAKQSIFANDVRHIRRNKMQRRWRDVFDFEVRIERHRTWDDFKSVFGPDRWLAKHSDDLVFSEDGWQRLHGYIGTDLAHLEGWTTAKACKDALKKGDL